MDLYNPAAERAVLSGVIKGGSDAFLDVDDIVRTEFFFQESSQAIWKCVKHIYDKDVNAKVDLTTIISTAHEIGLGGFFDEKSQMQYLRSISQLDFSPSNVRSEAQKVTKLAIARQALEAMDKAKQEIYKITGKETLSHILSIPEQKMAELSSCLDSESEKTELIGAGGSEWLENILANPTDAIGISTGFGLYDTAIGGGIRRKTVHLIAARAKCGKSSITDAVCNHVAGVLKIPVLNIDTEMSKDDHLARVCANLTSIEVNRIEKGKVTHAEKIKLRKAMEHIQSIPYYYRCVANYSFDEILAIIKRWVIKDVGTTDGRTNDCLVVYDYFKLMGSNSLEDMQEYQALGFQLDALNAFAKKYDFPCLSFAQTNRDGVTSDTIDTLAGSDRLSWFASSVSLFKAKTSDEIAQDGVENGNRRLCPLVARYGPAMPDNDYINMNMRGEYCRITELGTRSQSEAKRAKAGFEVSDEAPI